MVPYCISAVGLWKKIAIDDDYLLLHNSLKRIRQIYMSVSSSFFCSILFVTNKFLHHEYDNDNDGFGDDDRYDDANKAFFLLLIILFVY